MKYVFSDENQSADVDMEMALQGCNDKLTQIVNAIQSFDDWQNQFSTSRLSGSPQPLFTERAFGPSFSRSPREFKDSYLKVQEEITGVLKHSVGHIHEITNNELTSQLQKEIEKNNELLQKNDALSKQLHSMSLFVNDEIMRCLYAVGGFGKMEESSTFASNFVKDELTRLKNELKSKFGKSQISNVSAFTLQDFKSDYERQKAEWEDSIKRYQRAFERELSQAKEELRREHELHMKTKMQLEEAANDLRYQSETSRSQLQASQGSTDLLHKKIYELEFELQERDKSLKKQSLQVSELETKIDTLAKEKSSLESEIERLRRENSSLNQQFDEQKTFLKEMQRNIEIIEERASKLEAEKRYSSVEFNDKIRYLEQERSRLEQELYDCREDLRRNIQKSEVISRGVQENNEKAAQDYTRQVETLKASQESYRAEKEADLRAKKQEIYELNLKLQTLEETAKSQENAIKRRDEKIQALSEEKSQLSSKVNELERQVSELNLLREKNKKNLDLLSEARTELNRLKQDNQNLLLEKQRLEVRAAERESEGRRTERDSLKYSARSSEVRQSETQLLRIQLEVEKQNVLRKERESK